MPFILGKVFIFKSVYGILKLLSMGIFQAVLAAKSAWSFPLIPMWLGIQHSSISLVFDRISSLFNICMVRSLSRFWFFRDVKTDKESEKMINLVDFVCVIILSARSMALASALLIEVLLGRFVIFVLCWMAAHDNLFPFLELSV